MALLPPAVTHCFDDVIDVRAYFCVARVLVHPTREVLLVGVRKLPAILRPHVVDHAAVVLSEKRTGGLFHPVSPLVRIDRQVGLDELLPGQLELSGDYPDVFVRNTALSSSMNMCIMEVC